MNAQPAAILTSDGNLAGWTLTPDGTVWRPDADALWTPPGSKSGPDILGRVTSAEPAGDGIGTWVRVQLDKRARYRDAIRELVIAKVKAGLLTLTAELAALLGLPYPQVDAVTLKEITPLPVERLPDRLLAPRIKTWVSPW